MNRTGLFIALALWLVIGVVFGIFPELDLKLASLFFDPETKTFPVKLNGWAGFALLPAMIIAVITEAFNIRSVLAYAVGGGFVGLACYLGLVPFDPDTLRFEGIVRRHLEIMTGAGIVAGVIYWMIAGRNAGAWRLPPPPLPSQSRLPPPFP